MPISRDYIYSLIEGLKAILNLLEYFVKQK